MVVDSHYQKQPPPAPPRDTSRTPPQETLEKSTPSSPESAATTVEYRSMQQPAQVGSMTDLLLPGQRLSYGTTNRRPVTMNNRQQRISIVSEDNKSVGFLFALGFFLELLCTVALGVLAYFLRFTDTFTVYNRGVDFCNTLIWNGPTNHTNPAYYVPDELFYPLVSALPIAIIAVGEIVGMFLGNIPTKSLNLEGYNIPLWCRRIIRFIGVFAIGFFLTSIIVDTIKCLSGVPRPFYPTCCCPNASAQTERNALQSFPSSHSAIAAYSAVISSLYINYRMNMTGVYVLRPIFITGLLTLAALASWYQYQINANYWQDIFVGALIGSGCALYQSIVILHKFHDEPHNVPMWEDSDVIERTEILEDDSFHLPRVPFGRPVQAVNQLVDPSPNVVSNAIYDLQTATLPSEARGINNRTHNRGTDVSSSFQLRTLPSNSKYRNPLAVNEKKNSNIYSVPVSAPKAPTLSRKQTDGQNGSNAQLWATPKDMVDYRARDDSYFGY